MKLRWLIPLSVLLPMKLAAFDPVVGARIATITLNPHEVTPLHLRPEFESTIHMPEEVTSVILGSPSDFKAEHSEAEPQYVYVKPITKQPAQSNLLIATKSGQHVVLELISDGAAAPATQPVDFLIEYKTSHSFLLLSDNADPSANASSIRSSSGNSDHGPNTGEILPSPLDVEFRRQASINAPSWTRWPSEQIETSLGELRQWANTIAVSYSVYNASDHPVEIVPPQIQISGHKAKKKKEGKGIIADQLEIRDYKLSATRLEPGGRADGVVIFDRPNFKESTEKLFLQLAQADSIDRPVLVPLPFTPPIASDQR